MIFGWIISQAKPHNMDPGTWTNQEFIISCQGWSRCFMVHLMSWLIWLFLLLPLLHLSFSRWFPQFRASALAFGLAAFFSEGLLGANLQKKIQLEERAPSAKSKGHGEVIWIKWGCQRTKYPKKKRNLHLLWILDKGLPGIKPSFGATSPWN